MRSVFVLLKDTSHEKVEAYLNSTFARNGPEWMEEYLYIRYYADAAKEYEPELLEEIQRRTDGRDVVMVMADISGRVPGDAEARSFCECMLTQFSGWAMDEYTDHLWTFEEIRSSVLVQGHPFFDYSGWYEERFGKT